MKGEVRISAPWLSNPAVGAVMEALGGEALFVGGCVRDALLGVGATDIDLSTRLHPERVVELIEAAGLRAIPTGIAHGTVTAVALGAGFEITTWRRDVETDGRRAVVRFAEDIAEDAMRRDFTINALYADREGRLVDPLGGHPDLLARRLRFIGRAEDRIREDYLRILRFFRFFAWYGAGAPDAEALEACRRLAPGMERLARERIGHEMRKLLAAPDPMPAMEAMARTGVLALALPGAEAARLPPVLTAEVEAEAGLPPDWPRRLAALGATDSTGDLRLSRSEARRQELLIASCTTLVETGPSEAPETLARIAWRRGGEFAIDAWTLARAAGGELPWTNVEHAIRSGTEAPALPLKAKDLAAEGLVSGPALGRALAAAEDAWVASMFTASPDALRVAAIAAAKP